MMDQLTFGIALPTHNRPNSLLVSINSVLTQSYPHWRLVIVDDSTNDDTLRWAENCAFDNRITYTKNLGHRGVGYSRNVALDRLNDTVDYIVFLDDDDYFDSECLLNASRFIKTNSSHHWYISRRISARTGKSITQVNTEKNSYDYLTDVLFGDALKKDATHFIATSAIKARRARFDERIPNGGEWRFFLQLGEVYPLKFFEGGVSYGDHLTGGLSDCNRKNTLYKLNENYDMYKFLATHNLLPQQQARLLHRVIKFAHRSGEYKIFNELTNRQLDSLPLFKALAIRFKLLYYRKLCGSGNY